MKIKKINLNKKVSLGTGALIIALSGSIFLATTLAILEFKMPSLYNNFSGERENVNVGIIEKDATGKEYVFESNDGLELTKIGNEKTFSKTVAVQNISTDAYKTGKTLVRMRIVPAFVYDSGTHQGQTVAVDMDLLHYTVSDVDQTNKWYAYAANSGDEKYFYYTEPIDANAHTPYLSINGKYDGVVPQNSHLEIQILTEGISYNTVEKSDGWKYAAQTQAWNVTLEKIQSGTPITSIAIKIR